MALEVGKLFKKNVEYMKPVGGENTGMTFGGSITAPQENMSTGNIAFTVTAPNLRIDVDSPLKLELVKTLITHAENQFKPKESSETDSENSSNHIEEED